MMMKEASFIYGKAGRVFLPVLLFTAAVLSACTPKEQNTAPATAPADTNTISDTGSVQKTTRPQPDQVTIFSGGCFGKCPIFTVKVNKDLHFEYEGQDFIKPLGPRDGTVTQALWDTLVTMAGDFTVMQEIYEGTDDDLETEWLFEYGSEKKRIAGGDQDLPESLKKTIQWVTKSLPSWKFHVPKTNPVFDILTHPKQQRIEFKIPEVKEEVEVVEPEPSPEEEGK